MADVLNNKKNGELLDGRVWFQRRDDIITLGLTNVAIQELGEINSVEFPNEGDDFAEGDILATVEGSLSSFELPATTECVVIEVNEAAKTQPEMVSEDPLEEGWIVKVQASNDDNEDDEEEDEESEDEEE